MTTFRISLVWSFLDKYSSLVITTATTIILSRLLTPVDVGIYSISSSLVGFAHMLRDFGIGTYILQEKHLSEIRLRTALGISILVGWTTAAFLALVSWPMGVYYGEAGVGEVTLVLAGNFVLLPFGSIFMVQLRRDMPCLKWKCSMSMGTSGMCSS